MQVKLPLEVGTRVSCKWRHDDTYHMARVIERRPAQDPPSPSPEVYDYYVHYLGCECVGRGGVEGGSVRDY